MSGVDITVVIVNYNVRPFLDHCLQSVFRAMKNLQVQVIVVDNASADDSAEMVRTRYPQVTLIENIENVGFAKANNQAFKLADGEAVLILNPDSFVQEDTLELMLARLNKTDDVGAIGPKILLPDGRFEPRSMRGFPTPWAAFSYLSGLSTLFPKSSFFSRYLLTYLDRDREQDVDALSGSCMMVKRQLLDELGGFDGDYFMYGEDLDLCYRIKRKGYRIIYHPDTLIVHFKGESTRRSDIDHRFHFREAMRLFVAKNMRGNVSKIAAGIIGLGFWFQRIEVKIIAILAFVAMPVVDIALLNVYIFLGRWIRFSAPDYDSTIWLVNGIYSLFYIIGGLYFGIYRTKKFSGRLSLYTAMTAAFGAAAFTYFFQQWAFSRFVVLWFSALMMLSMPAWRILLRDIIRRKPSKKARSIIQRRALIIGTNDLGRRIGKQLGDDPASDTEPVGFIDLGEDCIGKIIEGIPVIGNVRELDRIIETENVHELIFSTEDIPYENIIELIQSLQNRRLNFKIAPTQKRHGQEELSLLHLQLSSVSKQQ